MAKAKSIKFPDCNHKGKPLFVSNEPTCPKCGGDMQSLDEAKAAKPNAAKVGARHSVEDTAHIQRAHDSLVQLGATCSPASADKSVDLDEQIEDVRQAFYAQFPTQAQYAVPQATSLWVERVYDDAAIVSGGEDRLRVPYTRNGDQITFAPREQWQAVEVAYVPASSADKSAKAANMADWLEASLHQIFTNLADEMAKAGSVTRDERIALSGIVGDALGTFHDGLQKQLPQLSQRAPYAEADDEGEGDASKAISPRADVSAADKERAAADAEHFADPVNKKYKLDSEEQIRAAWNYIHHADNAAKYDKDDVARIKERIKSAARHHGVEISE